MSKISQFFLFDYSFLILSTQIWESTRFNHIDYHYGPLNFFYISMKISEEFHTWHPQRIAVDNTVGTYVCPSVRPYICKSIRRTSNYCPVLTSSINASHLPSQMIFILNLFSKVKPNATRRQTTHPDRPPVRPPAKWLNECHSNATYSSSGHVGPKVTPQFTTTQ